MLALVRAVLRLTLWATRMVMNFYGFSALLLIHFAVFGIGPEGFVRPLMEQAGLPLHDEEEGIRRALEEAKAAGEWVAPFQWDLKPEEFFDPYDVDPLDWGRLRRQL